ncbi:PTS sugar transporter subunit IIA [Enterococcus termitis]|jgi:PTS system galactitol-specific IIA component|uniref:PTS sugar transporter subunit IIA n=1 Tax=Enterococcus termitis TaxID=332950 RepID=A0A1E5GX84_9ENTE|nr:PTS sugar transporter subunit IIA [Enterococcus termitis]OEG16920.1 PTS sugar transporter subunit IIA [Enterococcus termitis]
MNTKEMFQPKLIDLQVSVQNEEELFELIAARLQKEGYVNDGYLAGIKAREKEFPTGLITEYLNIALPHSDTEYIERPFIYIVRTTDAIKVKQMGDNQEMEVKDLFFLGIKEPTKQVGLLQELMLLFQNQGFVSELKQATEKEDVFNLFMKQWEEVKNG